MDGTPIFNLVKNTLPGCKVLSFKGILNSTTNFVLEEMENGNSYEDAIIEAKRRGFAEEDPSMDIDGWDAAAKTAALLNVLMDTNINPTEIDRQGIAHITLRDIETAKEKQCKIKLLCEGYIEDNIPKGKVHPVYVSNKDILSNIDATSSILGITTDLMGEVQIIEKNPEIQQTAYGIYSDLLTLIKGL
jgi:homoserine dehydrogenase